LPGADVPATPPRCPGNNGEPACGRSCRRGLFDEDIRGSFTVP
jgi:hypothetical protein